MTDYTFPPDERMLGRNNEDRVHKVLLRMLKILFNICEQHDISFWLDYGTMLGAVRHQGFIPWDMEADVGMLRSDFQKLKSIAEDILPEDIFFQTKESDPHYLSSSHYLEAKLRDKYSNYKDFQKNNPNIKWHNGIQVDIFVYDTVTLDGQVCLLNKFEKIWTQCNSYFLPNEMEILELMKFEDTYFYVPKGYHLYLTRNYGDYMKLPPSEQCKPEDVDVYIPCDHKETLTWK